LGLKETDGRSFRRKILHRYSIRHNTFARIDADEMHSEGWFKRELRCSRDLFNIIVHRIEARWEFVNPRIDNARAVFDIRERLAVTLYHQAHTGIYAESGFVFGMSKTRTMLYLRERNHLYSKNCC
jgi:hypothetical protein